MNQIEDDGWTTIYPERRSLSELRSRRMIKTSTTTIIEPYNGRPCCFPGCENPSLIVLWPLGRFQDAPSHDLCVRCAGRLWDDLGGALRRSSGGAMSALSILIECEARAPKGMVADRNQRAFVKDQCMISYSTAIELVEIGLATVHTIDGKIVLATNRCD